MYAVLPGPDPCAAAVDPGPVAPYFGEGPPARTAAGRFGKFYEAVRTLAGDPRDGSHRDRQPRRPVPRLVGRLVHGLVEFVGGEQLPGVARVIACHRRVALAERGAVAV